MRKVDYVLFVYCLFNSLINFIFIDQFLLLSLNEMENFYKSFTELIASLIEYSLLYKTL